MVGHRPCTDSPVSEWTRGLLWSVWFEEKKGTENEAGAQRDHCSLAQIFTSHLVAVRDNNSKKRHNDKPGSRAITTRSTPQAWRDKDWLIWESVSSDALQRLSGKCD